MKATAFALFLAGSATLLAQPQLPSKAALARYGRELDHLEKYCMRNGCFSDPRFWRESLRVAQRTDPGITHAIMLRSRRWRGEEGLVFVPVLALLPRPAVTRILRGYERSKHELEQVWAREFFTEFQSEDVHETVRKLSSSQKRGAGGD